ncbi:MAG: pilus assembly protein [Phycisphaerales bacterium]|nr:pilus assembly protein [Phycisphaerales bacterium]
MGLRIFRRPGRRGVATVEMAVVAPLLLLLLFGAIEFGWIFLVQQTMTNSAREACRMAVLQGADRDAIIEHFRSAMRGTGLVDGQIKDGDSTAPCPAGSACGDWTLNLPSQAVLDDRSSANETVTITVTVPNTKVSLAGLARVIGFKRSLHASCTMRKEGVMGGGSG